MFIGHYGVSFAAKAADKRLPLWLLFLAVQWLDIVWSALVMLNVEHLRIVKGLTEGSSLELYYMPYTHGLIGAAALSAALGALGALFARQRRRAGGRRGVFPLAARSGGPCAGSAAAGRFVQGRVRPVAASVAQLSI